MARTGAPAEDRRTDNVLLEMALAKLQYFSSDLARLRLAVAELKGLSEKELSKGVPSSVYIDADTVGPFERGFYPREYDGEGRPFRWAGDGDFVELRFFINRNVANRFEITGYLQSITALGAVRAFVDYFPILLDVSYQDNQVILSGEIPPAPLETRATLTLWSPDRFVPQTGDGRSLWFIFSQLAVDPIEEAEAAVAPVPPATAKKVAVEAQPADGKEAGSNAEPTSPGAPLAAAEPSITVAGPDDDRAAAASVIELVERAGAVSATVAGPPTAPIAEIAPKRAPLSVAADEESATPLDGRRAPTTLLAEQSGAAVPESKSAAEAPPAGRKAALRRGASSERRR